jgi:hypothetical protein
VHLRRVQDCGVLIQWRVPRRVLLVRPPHVNGECEYDNGASVPDLQPYLGDDNYLNFASYDYDFASYDYDFASYDYSGTGNHYNDNGAG